MMQKPAGMTRRSPKRAMASPTSRPTHWCRVLNSPKTPPTAARSMPSSAVMRGAKMPQL